MAHVLKYHDNKLFLKCILWYFHGRWHHIKIHGTVFPFGIICKFIILSILNYNYKKVPYSYQCTLNNTMLLPNNIENCTYKNVPKHFKEYHGITLAHVLEIK